MSLILFTLIIAIVGMVTYGTLIVTLYIIELRDALLTSQEEVAALFDALTIDLRD